MSIKLHSKLKLNSGYDIPVLGLGTYKSEGAEAENALKWAARAGYRLIDTAAFYANEKSLGNAIQKCGVARNELFITSKIWETDHGSKKPYKAIERSLGLLQTDYLDLYLIHWPHPETRLQTWTAMEQILAAGKVKSIGVSNYTIKHLEELFSHSDIVPAVNQIEFHPFQYEKDLLEYCNSKNIVVQAYCPLIQTRKNDFPVIAALSKKYKKTPSQVLLRWDLQHGVIPLPKSVNEGRIMENINVFDFEIEEKDMDELDSIKERYRVVSWNPNDDEWK